MNDPEMKLHPDGAVTMINRANPLYPIGSVTVGASHLSAAGVERGTEPTPKQVRKAWDHAVATGRVIAAERAKWMSQSDA